MTFALVDSDSGFRTTLTRPFWLKVKKAVDVAIVQVAGTDFHLVVAGALGGVGVGTLLLGAALGTGSAYIYLRQTSPR